MKIDNHRFLIKMNARYRHHLPSDEEPPFSPDVPYINYAALGMQEVNQNVAQTSGVADIIAHDIADTNRSVREISNGSAQVLESAEELAKLSEQLREMSERFRI